MVILRGIAIAVTCAGLALVSASPASADDFEGAYTLDIGGAKADWMVTPCEDSDPSVTCVHVSQTGDGIQPWSGNAYWSVGEWSLVVERPDAIGCADGKTFAGPTTYSWDAVTYDGWVSVHNPGDCGGKPQTITAPIVLTKA